MFTPLCGAEWENKSLAGTITSFSLDLVLVARAAHSIKSPLFEWERLPLPSSRVPLIDESNAKRAMLLERKRLMLESAAVSVWARGTHIPHPVAACLPRERWRFAHDYGQLNIFNCWCVFPQHVARKISTNIVFKEILKKI